MDIYALNDSRLREHVVDRFESAIWTERYAEMGEFQMVLESTDLNRSIFTEGRWLVQNSSYRVMVCETYEDVTDTDGRKLFKPSGRSLEYIFEERIAAASMIQVQANGRWTIVDTPFNILKHIFQKICIEGILNPLDIIPNVSLDDFPYLPVGTNVGSPEVITLELEVKTLYETFRDICTTYSLGFAFLMDPTNGRLYFQVVTGTVRTSGQTEVAPVIFSPELDNLSNTSELASSKKIKNVAVVVSDFGSVTVYANEDDAARSGFQRRVLLVRTSDIKEEDVNKTALLTKIGRAELAKNRRILAFDGEIPQRSYVYGIDYFMGDITEMRAKDSGANYMKVTEQIFVDDSEGERSYPTLSLQNYIAPGSWYGYNPNVRWHDVDDDIVWNDTWEEGEGSGPGPIPEPDNKVPTARKSTVTGTKQTIPTHVSPAGGQTTNPSVVDFGADWNGYRYWMSHMPYPAGNADHADPNIAVSHDGVTWGVPTGLVNPLDNFVYEPDQKNKPTNGESNLMYHAGQLFIFWRTTIPGDQYPNRIYVRSSFDGIHWSAKALIWQSTASVRLLSPSFIFEGGSWTMYAIDMGTNPNRVVMARSLTDAMGPYNWSPLSKVVMPLRAKRDAWNLSMRKIGERYVGVLNDCDINTTGANGDLFVVSSTNGVNFIAGHTVAVPRIKTGLHTMLIRGSLVQIGDTDTYHMWYSGAVTSPKVVWNMFRATLT